MSQKTRTLTGLALMTAIVVVLQIVASFVSFGPFTITLALAPIIIGAALYGPKAGAYLGAVFGVVVLVFCIMGRDAGGNILWNAQPLLTAVLCVGKGALAGLAAGAVFRAIAVGRDPEPLDHAKGAPSCVSRRKALPAAILSGIVCPVVNTGIFLLGLYFLFHEFLVSWATAAGANIITYILTGLIGVNFILELAVNLVLSSVIVRVVSARSAA